MNGKTRHKKIWLKTWAFNVLSAFRHTTILKIKLLSIYQEETTQSFFWYYYFLNVGLLKESIFLTTFYGLYFSHQYTNITNYISSWKTDAFTNQATTAGQSSYLFSLKNSRPCRDLNPGPPRTKPICYQLSYPVLE